MKYNLVAISNRTGDRFLLTSSPLSYHECTVLMSKFIHYPQRRLEIERAPEYEEEFA